MITKEFLISEYTQGCRSCADIAAELSVTPQTVLNWLRRHEIDVRSSGSYRVKISVGDTFDKLSVMERSNSIDGRTFWKCKCSCGDTSVYPSWYLNLHAKTPCKACKTCRPRSSMWSGFGDVGSVYFSQIAKGASKRGFEFSISIEFIWHLFVAQDGKCALTGREIGFKEPGSRTQTASLDRIDSSIGYVEGNVRWLHKDVNRSKMDLSDEEFLILCKEVIEHDENRKKLANPLQDRQQFQGITVGYPNFAG